MRFEAICLLTLGEALEYFRNVFFNCCPPQDLLSPTALLRADSAGLNIREDPSAGFFVEGLRECAVQSHQEVWYVTNDQTPPSQRFTADAPPAA